MNQTYFFLLCLLSTIQTSWLHCCKQIRYVEQHFKFFVYCHTYYL